MLSVNAKGSDKAETIVLSSKVLLNKRRGASCFVFHHALTLTLTRTSQATKKGALTFVDEKKKLEAAKDACRSPVNAQSRMECRYMPHQPARSSRRTGVAAAWREEDFDLWEKKGGKVSVHSRRRIVNSVSERPNEE